MPDSVFDLGGSLTIDTEQLKTISDAVRDELAKVDREVGHGQDQRRRRSGQAQRARHGDRCGGPPQGGREEAHAADRHREGPEPG